MKKIVYVSGTRADFNLMTRPLLELKKHLDLRIIATGMHLSERWGYTIQEIKKYGFNVTKAKVNLQSDNFGGMIKSFGTEIIEITNIIEEIHPKLIFVEGDRGEALAGAIIGAHLNIPVFHHGGGDISGSIDNKIRYAITMFSDYHLTGNIESYNRLLKMGIPQSHIFNVGEPGLDDIIAKNYTKKDELIKKYGIHPDESLLLLIYHPNTNEYASLDKQIIEILEAIKELRITTIGLYANADTGEKIINNILEDYEKQLPFLKLYKHFYREDFYGFMNICSAMVGNSTAGITELPLFKKPFICVGTRQKGRLKAGNVIEVDYDKDAIIRAIKMGLYDDQFKKKLENLENPYGDGKAYLKITEIILNFLKQMD